MVQIIAGSMGIGKTRHLIEKANETVKTADGSIVYIDKNFKHMYELNNKIRLINMGEFPVSGTDGFLGFISGIISQDHDLQYMFLDSFLKLSSLEGKDISEAFSVLEALSTKYGINFVISIALSKSEIPEVLKDKVILSL